MGSETLFSRAPPRPAPPARDPAAASPRAVSFSPAGLQQRFGNQGAGAMLSRLSERAAAARAPSRGGGCASRLQAKLTVGPAHDRFEQEADRVADRVMRMEGAQAAEGEVSQRASGSAVRRLCDECEDEQRSRSAGGREGNRAAAEPELVRLLSDGGRSEQPLDPRTADSIQAMRGGGRPLPAAERAFFEPRFGRDFGDVRIHDDASAARAAGAIGARAFTLGSDVAFAAGQYRPGSREGRHLLAHELTHVVQQGHSAAGARVQRGLGDGHDLTSPRFSRLVALEEAYDNEQVIKLGASGRAVQAIQQALYDLGFTLPGFGADGSFGAETKSAVEAFQTANPPLRVDGEVGPATMAALDSRFGMPVLPAASNRSSRWDADAPNYTCLLNMLCPWSPHTVEVLRTRITLKSFDSISWADEEWDGSGWIPAPFAGAGYNTGTEIGVLNSSCEAMVETLYHEVLHAEQPTSHVTTLEKESYAYRIGEEFSIAMGLSGRADLRSTDAQGREFADPTKVGTFVAAEYPSVPSGSGGDEIIGKGATPGHVELQRPDGSTYTRPAAVGERVAGPITLANEVTHTTSTWTCP